MSRPHHAHAPLSAGVRVDRGQGLLSITGASATLAEMDAAISSIRGWQQRREREMADLMKRNAAALESATSGPAGHQEEIAGGQVEGEPVTAAADSDEGEEGSVVRGRDAAANGDVSSSSGRGEDVSVGLGRLQ